MVDRPINKVSDEPRSVLSLIKSRWVPKQPLRPKRKYASNRPEEDVTQRLRCANSPGELPKSARTGSREAGVTRGRRS